jgi:hypothetical protein
MKKFRAFSCLIGLCLGLILLIYAFRQNASWGWIPLAACIYWGRPVLDGLVAVFTSWEFLILSHAEQIETLQTEMRGLGLEKAVDSLYASARMARRGQPFPPHQAPAPASLGQISPWHVRKLPVAEAPRLNGGCRPKAIEPKPRAYGDFIAVPAAPMSAAREEITRAAPDEISAQAAIAEFDLLLSYGLGLVVARHQVLVALAQPIPLRRHRRRQAPRPVPSVPSVPSVEAPRRRKIKKIDLSHVLTS